MCQDEDLQVKCVVKKRIFECHTASYLDLTDGRGGREEVRCCSVMIVVE